VSNIYQSKAVDTSPTPAVPAEALVSLGEIAESAKEGLLALAVGAGMQVMYAMMDADVAALVGPKGKHVPDRAAVRHGHEDGSVTLGGGGYRYADHGCAPPTAVVRWRCRPTSCSRALNCC
jgi:putative transposase